MVTFVIFGGVASLIKAIFFLAFLPVISANSSRYGDVQWVKCVISFSMYMALSPWCLSQKYHIRFKSGVWHKSLLFWNVHWHEKGLFMIVPEIQLLFSFFWRDISYNNLFSKLSSRTFYEKEHNIGIKHVYPGDRPTGFNSDSILMPTIY